MLRLCGQTLISFAACDKTTKITEPELQAECPYTDAEIFANVRFVGQGGLDISKTPLFRAPSATNEIVILRASLGKRIKDDNKNPKDYGCDDRYFRACHGWILGWQAWNEVAIGNNEIDIPYDRSRDLSEIKLYLADAPGIDMTRVFFPVDEDIEIFEEDNGEIKTVGSINAQTAAFDSSLGDFGGYSLSISK